MQCQHVSGSQQCRLPLKTQSVTAQAWQRPVQRYNLNRGQHQLHGKSVYSGLSSTPGHRHAAATQRTRHVVTAASAAADMGGQQGLSLPDIRNVSWIRKVLQPSKYDAELFSLAGPALAAMALEPLMNVFSAAVLGHLGTQQLGAVSLASLATSLATYVFSFLVFLTTPRIAAAHANGEKQQIARLAAVGLWLAAGTGVFVAIGMNASAGAVVAAMKPAETEVAAYAVQYISVRSWGILAAMLGFVASGTYRGVKDTRTPLIAALGAALTHVVLTPLFIIGLKWGVWGAGLAATVAQWVSCTMLVGLLFKRQLLRLQDLAKPPQLDEVLPYLSRGLVLAFRMLVTFGMVMFASTICVRAGAASQAAFEIIRQVWVISIQLFESLNVATQAVAAGFLGQEDRTSAREVLDRSYNLACAIGVAIGVLLFAAQGPIVKLFTKDAAVALLAGAIMPIIAVFMPLDAGASIMDGGLIAAGQTNTLSVIQVIGSFAQYAVLAYLVSKSMENVVTVWATLKISTIARIAGGYWTHFVSSRSAYRARGSSQQQQQQLLLPQQGTETGSSVAHEVHSAAADSSSKGSSSNASSMHYEVLPAVSHSPDIHSSSNSSSNNIVSINSSLNSILQSDAGCNSSSSSSSNGNAVSSSEVLRT